MVTSQEAEERWKGTLGDEYTKRNAKQWAKEAELRKKFWDSIIDKYELWKGILECGCGDGKNLINIPWGYGIDVNFDALWELKEGCPAADAITGSILDIPFKDNFFDLVFTCGVRIHIPDDGLKKALSEIYRVSNKYILIMEYYAEETRERPFLGEMGITWERPYDKIIMSWCPRLKPIEKGFLTKKEGFNNIHYWMFKK